MSKATDDARPISGPEGGRPCNTVGADATESTAVAAPAAACPACGSTDLVAEGVTVGACRYFLVWWVNVPTRRTACAGCGLVVTRIERLEDLRAAREVRDWRGYVRHVRDWWNPRRRHRARHGLCLKCGYDLRGSPPGRCPECGEPTPTTRPVAPSDAAS